MHYKYRTHLKKSDINVISEIFPEGGRYCLHDQGSEHMQVMMIYMPPHAEYPIHRHPEVLEYYFVLQGDIVLTITDRPWRSSRYQEKHIGTSENSESCFYRMESRVWHSIRASEDGATFLELKPGPWARDDTEFPDL
jgi:cupin fold WbuC family metalloprotein